MGGCDMVLQVKDAKIMYEDELEGRIPELSDHPLSFSFQDGRIEEICPSSADDSKIINVKRAMLSALQNSMSNLDEQDYVKESDIVGTCFTRYEVMDKSGRSTIIKKTKELKNCENRLSGNTAILLPLQPAEAVLPIMKDEFYQCEQTISSGIITNVDCVEKSIFTPFSSQGRSYESKAEIRVSLESSRPFRNIPSYEINEREHLLYSHQPMKYSDYASGEATRILREICSKISHQESIDPEIPRLFSRLVQTLRRVQPRELIDIYDKVDSGQMCQSPRFQSLVSDALPYIGNEGAVKIMVKKIQSSSVSKLHRALWATSFAFIEDPTEGAISAAVPLLDYEKAGKQALLGVTAMCNNYCSKNTNCEHTRAIQEVISSLTRYLGYGCKASGKRERDQVITALKAFGNVGRVGDASRQILQCATQTSNDITVRLAAIEAFRRTPCKEEVKEQLYNIFSRTEEQVEVRIAAYLGAMNCADRELVRRIKRVYDSERLIQLKAFIYSHVTNLQESSSPLKENIKKILLEFHFDPQPLDIRKYSQYVEWSTYFERMNMGGEFESAVIYNQDSFLPRSIMTNFTSFYHGNVLNIMEVGGRVEGLDHFLESLFSPTGEYGRMSFSDFAKNMVGMGDKYSQPMWSSSKFYHNKYQPKINSFSEGMKFSVPSNARGSFYFKHQGSELLWVSIDKETSLNIGTAVDFMDILTDLSRTQRFDTANALYLDTSIVYPSISGGALTLDVNGSLVVGLKGEGKVDVRKALSSPQNVDIEGKVRVSAATEANVVLYYNSYSKSSSIKYVVKAHGDVVVKGKFSIKDGRLLNMRVDLPEEKIDVLSVSMDVVHVDERGREMSDRPTRDLSGCVSMFRKAIGYDICSEVSLPKPVISSKLPFFPLTGPFATKITLVKQDRSMRGFVLNVELPEHNVYSTKKLKIEFDTPGSSYNRKYSLEVVVVESSDPRDVQSFDIQLQTPYKVAEARVAVLNSEQKKSLKVDLILDRRRHWALLADMEARSRGNVKEYETKLQLSSPDKEPIKLAGSVTYKQGRKTVVSINLHSNVPSRQPMQITGDIMKEGDFSLIRQTNWKLSINMNAKLPFLDTQISGVGQQNGKIMTTDMTIDYQRPGRRRHNLQINSKVQNLSTRSFTKMITTAEVHSTQNPELGLKIDWDLQYKPSEHLENDLTIKGGSDLRKIFYVLQISKIRKNGRQKFTSDNKLVVTAPEQRIDYELAVSIDHDGETPSSVIGAEIKQDQQIYVKSSIKYYLLSKTPLKVGVDFNLEYPGRDIQSLNEISEISPREYRGTSKLQWQEGQQANFDYTYRIKSQSDNIHHEVDASLDAPWLRVPVEHKGLLRMSGGSLDFRSSTNYKGKKPYKVDAKISPKGMNKLNVDMPTYGKSDVQFDLSGPNTLLKFDITRPETNRRILGQVRIATEPNPAAQFEVNWDADRDPTSRLSFETEAQTVSSWSEKYYVVTGKAQYMKDVYIDVKGRLDDKSWNGPHDFQVEVRKRKPISLKIHHEVKDGVLNSELTYDYENQQLHQISVKGKHSRRGARTEYMCDAAITSSNRNWDGKELHYAFVMDNSGDFIVKSHIQVNQSPSKLYSVKTDYFNNYGRNGPAVIKASFSMQTPIRGWKTREINVNLETKRGNHHSFSADYTTDLGRQFSVSGEVESTPYGATLQADIHTPASRQMQNGKVQIAYQLKPSNYRFQGQILVDDETVFDVMGSYVGTDKFNFDYNFEFKSRMTSTFGGRMHSKMDSDHKEFDVVFTKNSVEKFSGKLSADASRSDYNGGLEIDAEGRRIIDMSISCQHRNTDHKGCRLSVSGSVRPLLITLTYRKEGSLIIPTIKICRQTKYRDSECTEIEAHYRNEYNHYYGTDVFDTKVTVRRPRAGDVSLEIVGSLDKNNYKNKVVFTTPSKKLGYDAHYNTQSSRKSGQVEIYFPSRVMKAQCTLQAERDVILNAELMLDAEKQPLDKLSLEVVHKDNKVRSNRQIFSRIELRHPEFRKPMSAKFEYNSKEMGDVHPVDAKVELDYSDDPKEKIISSIHMETTPSGEGNNTFVFNIHKAERRYLDLTVKSHLGYTRDLMSLGYQWEFLSQRSRRKSSFTFIEVAPQDKTFGIWHQCDITNFAGRGRWSPGSDNVFKAEFNFALDDRQPRKIAAIVDYRQPCLDVAYHSRADEMPKTKYHFCVNAAGRDLLSITSNTFYDSGKVSDFSLVLDKNSNRAFTLDLKWMPEILGKILDYISDLSVRMHRSRDFMFPVEILELYQDMSAAVKRDFYEPTRRFVSQEYSQLYYELQEDVESAKITLQELYDQLPSKYEIEKALQPLKQYVEETTYELKTFFEQIFPLFFKEFATALIEKVMELEAACNYGTYCYELKSEYERYGVKGALREILGDLIDLLHSSVRIKFKLGTLGRSLTRPLQDILSSLKRFYDQVYWRYNIAMTYWGDLMTQYIRPVGKLMNAYEEYISKYFYQIRDKLEHVKNSVLQNRDVRALMNTLREIKDEAVGELRRVRIEQLARQLKDSFKQALSSMNLRESVSILVFDPDQGKLRIEIYSPVDPRSARHVLKSMWHPSSTSTSFFPKLPTVSAMLNSPWFPPFAADAVVVGGQHFKTFDDNTFSVSGDCSYLLTHDFVDSNFTIVAKHVGTDNYGQPEKALVILNSEFEIEINPLTSRVHLNGEPIELPYFSETVSITRQGSMIEVRDSRGVDVKCHLVHQFCTASLSGWYYGKTAGLFGTLDYEPGNDFLDSTGSYADSAEQFSQQWKVSPHCSHSSKFMQWSNPDPASEGYRVCQRYFDHPESPLQPCFGGVDPLHYFNMCLRASSSASVTPKPVCNVAASYASICQKYGYRVVMPSECSECSWEDGSKMEYGDIKTMPKHMSNAYLARSVEVVFIIEESECNSILIRNLGKLADTLERKFRQGGYVNNRFGLVAFGGRSGEYKPHTHTARGKVLFSSDEVDIATENMKLSYESQGHLDVYAAILHANDLPFRESSSKAFIVMPCRGCDPSVMSVSYREMLEILSDAGVALHILSGSSLMPSFASSSEKFYGYDATTVFRSTDINQGELYREPSLRSDIRPSNDACVKLSMGLKGSHFSTEPHIGGSFSEAKAWTTLFSDRVSKLPEDYCRICHCVQDVDHVPKLKCFPCPSEE